MSGIANAIKKASKDADFRGRLLADPKAALEEIGASVKANTEVVVVENTADRVHLVLPPAGADCSELSEDELSAVAGGTLVPHPDIPGFVYDTESDLNYEEQLEMFFSGD